MLERSDERSQLSDFDDKLAAMYRLSSQSLQVVELL